ncbi:Smr/MutS family protein [Xanthobacteraceae bacterium Astr-EGSB]|uniref:Smr/MutS family protein n=1 Tax=Astrobacterium formosum TaxID=3069710 RepID=UPI0027AE14CE|nr:Smr/MutS family protein [Xanthobacteraceae bacterium Astr-EGSB]
MTSPPHQRPRRFRQLDPEERRLWKLVAKSVKPLRRRKVELDEDVAPAPPPAIPAAPSPAVRRESSAAAPPVSPPVVPPALAPLPRRERQRLARGTAEIDARIDLHGLTQAQAHAALIRFLRRARNDGARFALVITGKGARFAAGDGVRGLLKRQVPMWLGLPEFREHVVGFEDAHAVHGGEGALYVRLRRAGR